MTECRAEDFFSTGVRVRADPNIVDSARTAEATHDLRQKLKHGCRVSSGSISQCASLIRRSAAEKRPATSGCGYRPPPRRKPKEPERRCVRASVPAGRSMRHGAAGKDAEVRMQHRQAIERRDHDNRDSGKRRNLDGPPTSNSTPTKPAVPGNPTLANPVKRNRPARLGMWP